MNQFLDFNFEKKNSSKIHWQKTMIKRHKLCFSAANLILSECLFMTGMYLRRSILPLRWIVFSSHTATLLLQTLQHNNYLKYLTKFSLWFFLPRNIHKYAYEILFYTVMTEKKLLGQTSKSKMEIFFKYSFQIYPNYATLWITSKIEK